MRKTDRENQRDREIDGELTEWDFLRSLGVGGGTVHLAKAAFVSDGSGREYEESFPACRL
jgi:hypothetical protein